MWFFGSHEANNVNTGTEKFRNTPGAVLVDVRQEDEYASGHIPGSINIPSDRIDGATAEIPDKSTPVFVYCLSGARSAGAASWLRRAGYTTVYNIGGISSYRGEREYGAAEKSKLYSHT